MYFASMRARRHASPEHARAAASLAQNKAMFVAIAASSKELFPPYKALAKFGIDGQEVPAEIAKRRLPINKNGRLPFDEPRFVSRDETERDAAIFTWWDLLDGLMLKHEPRSRFMGGYIREVQLRRMLQLVRPSNVTRYCEIGMNGGHSVSAMLLGNPRVQVQVFDLMRWNYSQPVAQLLKARFGERFQLTEGYSYETLPPWVKGAVANGTYCDLLLVDGGHLEGAARLDMQMLRRVAAPNAKVIVDDINAGPGVALFRLEKMGVIRILERYAFQKKDEHNPCQRTPKGRIFPCSPWGFAVAEYVGKRPKELPRVPGASARARAARRKQVGNASDSSLTT